MSRSRSLLGGAARDVARPLQSFTISAAVALSLAACQDAAGPVAPLAASSPRLAAAPPSSASDVIPDEYIVTFAPGVSNGPALAQQIVAQHAGTLRFTYTAALQGFAAHLPPQAVAALQNNPQIARVEQDMTVRTGAVQSLPQNWGLDRIDQRGMPLDYAYTYPNAGEGVSVYIVDTGIRATHVEFNGRVTSGYTAINDGVGTGDCNGHGTHVAGIVGAQSYGVAKAVRLVAVRVLDCNGSGTMSGVVAGVDWLTKNKSAPAVANMSLAGSVSTTLNQAVQNAINAGVTFVVSAGNYSSDACNYSPASVQAAITVGASTGQDTQATFSNFGKCVDIYAPGVSILSTAFNSDTATAYLSGTSMSAPHVAGVASLYLAANPSASPLDVAIALTSNATANALTGVGPGSPNLLLYAGFIGSAPPAPSPAPPSPDSPPTASFTYSCARARCTFDAGGSSDDNGIISYSWSFGDGTSATSASGVVSVTHTYSSTGIYSVTLTVIDTARQLSSSTVSIKIRKI